MKVAAAFVAGVVVALGSALMYVRVSDSRARATAITPSAPIVQHAAREADVIPPPSNADSAAAEPAARDLKPPVAKAQAKPSVTHRSPIRHVKVAAAAEKTPLETAQYVPPPSLIPAATPPQPIPGRTAPVPAPAVNEGDALGPPQASAPQSSGGPSVEVERPQPHTVTLQPGTNLVIRLGETLSTDHNYTGDTFRGVLDAPIEMDGFIIADKGSKVLGRIVNAQKPGRMEGLADLNLTLTEINTTDGQRVRLVTNSSDRRGASSAREEAAKIGGGAALGAIIGAIGGGGKGAAIGAGVGGAAGTGAVLLGHGKPAVFENETRLTFTLTEPVTITEKLN